MLLRLYSSNMASKLVKTVVIASLCTTLGCIGDRPQTHLSSESPKLSEQAVSMNGDRESYAVYDALLGGPSLGGVGAPSDPLVIKDRSRAEAVCSDISTAPDPRIRAAGKDFVSKNSIEWLLTPEAFNLGRKVQLVSSVELDRIFAKGVVQGWVEFNQNYHGIKGYVDLSAVGFSPDKNFAVVYSAAHCGPKCGAGGFVALVKKDGKWQRTKDRLCSWIS